MKLMIRTVITLAALAIPLMLNTTPSKSQINLQEKRQINLPSRTYLPPDPNKTPPQQELPPIRNFLKVNEDFCTGGQPRLEHLEKLKADGVKAIINLRQPSEHRAPEEEEMAKKLGLRYINIPVVYGEPKEEQATEFLKITDDKANRPAFIHCAAAIRVGAFWMIRRVLRDGMTIEAAEEEAKKIGLVNAPHLNEFARKYIEKYGKK